jgi:prepilin-type N-terminal cleavage/methylation domain-containing protein
MRHESRQQRGFTLVELMIVVGMVGALAAIAIPNFLSYQARSRRSEAWVNVSGIVVAQKSYFAEKDTYHDSGAPWPDYSSDGGLSTRKRTWDAASNAAFEDLGWKPEGQVIYSYETNTTDNCGACLLCFTATAYGDADGDGLTSAVMYVQPGSDGSTTAVCGAKLLGLGTPTRKHSNTPVVNEIEVNRQTDEY